MLKIYQFTKDTAPGTKSKIEVLLRVDDSSNFRKINEKAAENSDFAGSDSIKTSTSSTSSSSNRGRPFGSSTKKTWTDRKEYFKEYHRNRRSSLSTDEKEAIKSKDNMQHYKRYHCMDADEKKNFRNSNNNYVKEYRRINPTKELSYEDYVKNYEHLIMYI